MAKRSAPVTAPEPIGDVLAATVTEVVPRPQTAGAAAEAAAEIWVRVRPDGAARSRPRPVARSTDRPEAGLLARWAVAGMPQPRCGDRVVVAAGTSGAFIIGLMPHSRRACAASAASCPFVVKSQGHATELSLAEGDLELSAPRGRVIVRAGTDVRLEAGRDLTGRADRTAAIEVGCGADSAAGAARGAAGDTDRAPGGGPEPVEEGTRLTLRASETRLDSPEVRVRAEVSELCTGHATVVARRLATTAATLVQNVERVEIHALDLIERTRNVLRETSGLVQQRAGRVRSLIEDSYTLFSGRTWLQSREETTVDGKKILLG
jgi:hypothetical protein